MSPSARSNPLDAVPLSGIFRIRDLMYGVERPFRLDHGDISFDTPAPIRDAMKRALDAGETHYVHTGGLPRLRELLAEKLRARNAIPVGDPDEVLVTAGGMHGLYLICRAALDPGDEVIVPDPAWGPTLGHILAVGATPVPLSSVANARLAIRPRPIAVDRHVAHAGDPGEHASQPNRWRANADRPGSDRRAGARA